MCIKGHTVEAVLRTCRLRSEEEIIFQADQAFLWRWRAKEVSNPTLKGRDKGIRDAIAARFGTKYDRVLPCIPLTQRGSIDFISGDLKVTELYQYQKRLLDRLIFWRLHALQWILGENSWASIG